MTCIVAEYVDSDVSLLGNQLKAIRGLQACLNNALSIRNFYAASRQASIDPLRKSWALFALVWVLNTVKSSSNNFVYEFQRLAACNVGPFKIDFHPVGR